MAKILKIYTTSRILSLYMEEVLVDINKEIEKKSGAKVEVHYISFRIPKLFDRLLKRGKK